MSKPINELAFPVVSVADHEFTGMTLRDYFAAKAMREIDWKVKPLNESADDCYAVADAMLAARSA
ncbi:hypothetical protein [Pseudomonas extremaustralis]|uniref:Uncharacterized protein n=1 Tax=Pseudomonas extremaustralis TaxID=359110 RepID=A0A5C5QAU1_9PSED|nr:hypothetical protein [Pseudomonas extremaustralis]EZI26373.1 hypothetical protein PE143B_0121550 [Pseudomonas extremaustralis 14-3 substr. 14-3b]TWS01636.1 hypothetical protein FIV36_23675 [Pseudomonas extremaustralis]SDE60828.1 hypothetical protein SAMN05216591_0361 [Pseudomonas extremaustralis]